MRTLTLTTPLMTGDDVGTAQFRLCCNNILGTRFYDGRVDHAWGEASAQAAYRARYWLGSSLADLAKFQGAYGDVLDGLLSGAIAMTPTMKALRTKRLAALNTTTLREKALAEAVKHVGEKENPPDSNICVYSKWYGITGPWCNMFVTYCYVAAGSKAFVKGQRYAYVPFMLADARAGRNNLSITATPQPGDVVTYDWDGDGVPDHTGLFKEGSPAAFVACEGNTSVGNDSNGGEVMLRNRTAATVSGFIHVGA